MKTYLYTTSYSGSLQTASVYRKVIFTFCLLSAAIITMGQSGHGSSSNSGPGNNNNNNNTVANQLSFTNARLETGTAGANGAIYRFPSVGSGIDALVKIAGRSDSKVKLVTIDLTNTGWQKAFQPQVGYNNSSAGAKEWWMDQRCASL